MTSLAIELYLKLPIILPTTAVSQDLGFSLAGFEQKQDEWKHFFSATGTTQETITTP